MNPGHVVQIDREHCVALLGGCAIGRVGALTGHTPRGFHGVGGRVVAPPLVCLTGSLIEPTRMRRAHR